MTIKITYAGDGKLDDWYGHEDYCKERKYGDINRVAFVSSTNSIAFWIDKFNEYHKIPLDEIERLTIE